MSSSEAPAAAPSERDYVHVESIPQNDDPRALLERKIESVRQEMMAATLARNFDLAKEKKNEIDELMKEQLKYLSAPELEAKIQDLEEQFHHAVEYLLIDEAEALHKEQVELKRHLEMATGPSSGPQGGQRSFSASSEHASNDDLYDFMTVFQSEPLVEMDSFGKPHAFDFPLDLDTERLTLLGAVKDSEKIGAKIDIVFEKATTSRLFQVLKEGQCRVVHYSGHGNKEFIHLENQLGRVDKVSTEELKECISSGEGTVQLVFVASCFSRSVGEAFVEAGVPHVVCLTQEESLYDTTAIQFAQNFYRGLACRRNLKEAFDLAEAAVEAAPGVTSQKFSLLPEKPEGDAYHEVQIFYDNRVSVRESSPPTNEMSSFLPKPPKNFYGRNVLMYELIKNLRRSRVIEITGSPRIGTSSFGQAACKFINSRKDLFFLDNVFWLPSLVHSDDNNDIHSGFLQVLNSVLEDGSPALESDNSCRYHCGKVVQSLQGSRSLIFIDAGDVDSKDLMDKLQMLLEMLQVGTEYVRVVFISPSGQQLSSKKIAVDKRIKLLPLTMEESVKMFARSCKFVDSSPIERSNFVNLLVPVAQADATKINKSMSSRCSKIFKLTGEGIPEQVLSAATKMSEEQYKDLMKVAERPEFQQKIETRAELDHEISKTKTELVAKMEMRDFKQVEDIQAKLEELEKKEDELPPVVTLRVEEAALFSQLNNFVSSEEYSKARKIHSKLVEIRRKILLEEKAMIKLAQSATKDYKKQQEAKKRSRQQQEGKISTVAKYKMSSEEGTNDGGNYTVVVSHGSIVDFFYAGGNSAIVVPTNESCYPLPGGADGAVGKAGEGPLKEDVSKLPAVDETDWGAIRCPTGTAKIVGPATYGKLHTGYVIFGVGPSYGDIDEESNQGLQVLSKRDQQLRSVYREALRLAKEKGLEAVAFSLISAGNRAGVHYERTLRVALEEVCGFEGYDKLKEIHLCAYESFQIEGMKKIADELGLSTNSPNPLLVPPPPSTFERMMSWIKQASSVSPSKSHLSESFETETPYSCPEVPKSGLRAYSLVVVKGSVLDYNSSFKKCGIVCPTNESCFPVQGAVDGAIGNAGGTQFKNDVRELAVVGKNEYGGIRCPTGEARIIGPKTYGSLKVPYVIFAVGPTYEVAVGDGKDTGEEKDEQLRDAYLDSLRYAKAAGLQSVAFSLLSAGKRAGSDVQRPLRIAVETISHYEGYDELKEIRLYGYLQREANELNKLVQDAGLRRQDEHI